MPDSAVSSGAFTNTVPVDADRGAGRPENNYLVERLMDAAARELGQDPLEFRKRNMVAPEMMSYRSAMGKLYDSGDFAHVLDAALRRADHARASPRGGRRRRRAGCCGAWRWPVTWKPRRGRRASAPRYGSRTTAAWTCWWARRARARGTRPPTCSSRPSSSGYRPSASGCARATAT